MTGKKLHIVLTGATSGIGLALAKAFFKTNHQLVLVARSKEKSAHIIEKASSENIKWLYCDLSLQKNVKTLCEEIKIHCPKIDVLIHCAGIVTSKRILTEEGIELQLAVNHIAPFLISELLKENLQKSANPKVITISSRAVYRGSVYWKDLMLTGNYTLSRAYNQSKLLNLLSVYAQAKINNTIKYLSFYPGLVNTEIGLKHTEGIEYFLGKILKEFGAKPSLVADKLVTLCEDDCAEYPSGFLLSMKGLAKLPRIAKNEVFVEKAYELTKQLISNGNR